MSPRVSVLALPASWGDPHGVLARVDELLGERPATVLVLLPEAGEE